MQTTCALPCCDMHANSHSRPWFCMNLTCVASANPGDDDSRRLACGMDCLLCTLYCQRSAAPHVQKVTGGVLPAVSALQKHGTTRLKERTAEAQLCDKWLCDVKRSACFSRAVGQAYHDICLLVSWQDEQQACEQYL